MSVQTENVRNCFWRKGWVAQHTPLHIVSLLDGVFEYKQVKWGDIKRGDGDVVIIGLKDENPWTNAGEYLGYILGIDRIESKGIYTNIYFSKRFFDESIKEIAG